MGGRRRVTAAEGGWAMRALQRRISFSSTVGLERGWAWIGILIEPAAKQSLATYRQFSIRAHLTFSPTSGPTRVLDEANILALEDNTPSHSASTFVLGKKFVGNENGCSNEGELSAVAIGCCRFDDPATHFERRLHWMGR